MHVTLHLGGDLDLSTCDRVEGLLRRVEHGLAGSPVGTAGGVVLDLSGVAFVDCTGLGLLLRARERLGDRLSLQALPVPVMQLLALTGTGELLGVGPATTSRSTRVPGGATGEAAACASREDADQMAGAVQRAAAELALLDLDWPLVRIVQRVVDLAAGLLPDVEGLGVALADRAQTSAFAGGLAAFLDERQYETGFGPCLHTARTGQAHDLDLDLDLDRERAGEEGGEGGGGRVVDAGEVAWSWPQFAAVARRRGVRSVVCLPVLDGRRRPVGALALYATGRVDDRTRLVAQAFTAHAGVVLANALAHAALADKAGQLQEALTSRAVIEQAKGVLMALHGIDADAAFERLSCASQATNTKLRVLAADIVARAARG